MKKLIVAIFIALVLIRLFVAIAHAQPAPVPPTAGLSLMVSAAQGSSPPPAIRP